MIIERNTVDNLIFSEVKAQYKLTCPEHELNLKFNFIASYWCKCTIEFLWCESPWYNQCIVAVNQLARANSTYAGWFLTIFDCAVKLLTSKSLRQKLLPGDEVSSDLGIQFVWC